MVRKLEHPEDLVVCQARHRAAEIAATKVEISELAPAGTMVGCAPTAVSVRLRADRQALADELLARYGELVEITLGLFPYPRGSRAPSPRLAALGRPSGLDGSSSAGGLTAHATLGSPSVRSGEELAGTVVVTNVGDGHVRSGIGSLVGYVVRSGTTDVVGVTLVHSMLAIHPLDLPAGASTTVPFHAGTASSVPDEYAVPPGAYEVLVPVPLLGVRGWETGMVAGPVALTVVA